jgi:hypothetical protein
MATPANQCKIIIIIIIIKLIQGFKISLGSKLWIKYSLRYCLGNIVGMRGHLSHYVKNQRVFESFRKNRRAFQSFAVKTMIRNSTT